MTLDGIPVGTIRSNLAELNITGDDWCRAIGSHRFAVEKDGSKWCKDCYKTEREINEQKENGIRSNTGN